MEKFKKFIYFLKRVLAVIIRIVLALWQAPQNIAGLVLLAWCEDARLLKRRGIAWIFVSKEMTQGSITLGQVIVLSEPGAKDEKTEDHEYGHSRFQSLIFGPFYLLIIGVQSIAHAMTNEKTKCCEQHGGNYDHFWTEKNATNKGAKYKVKDNLVALLTWLTK